ncbi:hypothetical protein, partial [Prevotella heparinolytica]
EIRGLVRKNKYSQHVIVNELGVDNYGLADSNNKNKTIFQKIPIGDMFCNFSKSRKILIQTHIQ